MSRTFKFAVAVFAIAATLAPAALAEPGAERVSVRVHYRDLDMSSQAGGQKLLRRIEGAAIKACDSTLYLDVRFRAFATCRDKAVETAVRSIDIGALNLAWSEKSPPTAIASR